MAVSKRKVIGLVLASVVVLAIGAYAFASWRASQFQRVEVLETLKGQIIELTGQRHAQAPIEARRAWRLREPRCAGGD